VATLLLLLLALQANTPGSLLWGAAVGPLTYGQVLTVVFLKVSLSGYLSVFSTRTVGPCFERAPGVLPSAAAAAACAASTVLATAWPPTAGGGHLVMGAISWGQAWFVWG